MDDVSATPTVAPAFRRARRYVSFVPLDDDVSQDATDAVRSGSVYTAVARALERHGFKRIKAATTQPWLADVLLGGPAAHGVPWKALACAQLPASRPAPLVNFYRGFECICRKAMLVRTLRTGSTADSAPEWLPLSFLFTPGRPDYSELEAVREAHLKRSGDGVAHWILKPSDGGKGARIKVMTVLEEIVEFLEAMPRGSIAWVVSEYLASPKLLQPGDRKFDVRVWVVLDSSYNVLVYKKGVLRTCSAPFSMDAESLSDEFVHLSNHCIQTKAERYGAHESVTNEVFFDAFDAMLKRQGSTATVSATYAPQWHTIIHAVLSAAKETLRVDAYSSVQSFQTFGFDFMIDAADKVWLVEVNSSPAIAEELAAGFAEHIVQVAILPYLDGARSDSAALGELVDARGDFELVSEDGDAPS
ncbi:tubulin-tyrosine ligase family-domain-containing protein [Pelagophyceae sp. CCMP2097]|nr:tubulin-tyrosine ligase family-domain-containing protein [Pelagophyceae sp. CCMP2097]